MQTVVQDVLVNYEIVGEKNKETLIVLHGWGRNLRDWLAVSQILSSKYKVVSIDLPGFGGTSYPSEKDLGTYDYADFVLNFMKKLDIQYPILLGHSLGGRIGIVMGAEEGLLKELVLVDAAGVAPRTFKGRILTLIFKLAKHAMPGFIVDWLRDVLGSEDYVKAGPLRKTLVKVVNEDLKYLLPKINCETLIIWGEKDSNQEIKFAKEMVEKIPNARLRVVWEAGHHPNLEKPKDFARIIKEELL